MKRSKPDERHCGLDGRRLWWVIVIGWAIWPGGVMALDSQFGLMVSDTFYTQRSFFDRLDNRFALDRSYNLLTVSPLLHLSFSDQASIFVSADLEWTYEPDAQSLGYEENEVKGMWTAANLTLGDRPFQMRLGVQAIRFGSNLITVDEVPAAKLTTAAGRWSMELQAARILHQSPMAGVNLAYEPGPFEQVNLFGAWFRDDENAFAISLPDFYQLLEPASSGQLWWAGATGQLFLGRILMSATAVYESGDIRFMHLLGETQWEVSAYLVDMGLEGNITDRVSLGLFFFMASGDDEARDKTLKSFISPLPFNPRADIFFDPEWLDRSIDDQMIYGGATLHGVLAPGITLSLSPMDDLLVTGTLATFYPQFGRQGGRDWYGWEADLDISYALTRHFEMYAQAARFEHGNYFENQQGDVPDPSFIFSIGGRMLIR